MGQRYGAGGARRVTAGVYSHANAMCFDRATRAWLMASGRINAPQ